MSRLQVQVQVQVACKCCCDMHLTQLYLRRAAGIAHARYGNMANILQAYNRGRLSFRSMPSAVARGSDVGRGRDSGAERGAMR